METSGRGRAGGGGGGPSLGTLGTVGGVGARSAPADRNQPIRVCRRPAGRGMVITLQSVNVKQQSPLATSPSPGMTTEAPPTD